MGKDSASCLVQGYISTIDLPFDDIPVELQIFRNTFLDLEWASRQEPFVVQSPMCLSECKGIAVCTEDVDDYSRQIPIVFNETVYGPECAFELVQKREELENSGLLGRIIEEAAFLECQYDRATYVFIAQQICFY